MDFDTLVMYAARILAFLTAIPFHEAAHAFVSDKLGDPTARNLGRLSLNPIRHLDPIGLLAMLLVGFGWAKPVPIDTRYYQNQKKGMALSAAAGPLSNLLLAFVLLVVLKIYKLALPSSVYDADLSWAIYLLLFYLVYINITLAIFNLIPVPPFDGSRIFLAFLPDHLYFGAMRYERYLGFVVVLLVWSGALTGVLGTVNSGVMRGMDFVTGFLGSYLP